MAWPPLPLKDPIIVTAAAMEGPGIRVALRDEESGDFSYLVPATAKITFASPRTRLEPVEAYDLLAAYLATGKRIVATMTFDGAVIVAAHFERADPEGR